MACVLTFPKCPRLDLSMCIPGSSLDAQRIKSRIDEESIFLVRMENQLGVKVDKVYPLPVKPKDCPPWRFAITAPALLKKEKGLLFALKERGIFWTLEKEVASKWVKLDDQINKEFILASMEIDPTPHKLFCQEILQAEQSLKKGVTMPLNSQNPWPENWHSNWLELLLETETFEENSDFKNLRDKTQFKFPMPLDKSKDLLNKLRRGTIVSMARRCSQELPDAYKILSTIRDKQPKDKTWQSLLDLCNS
jgi:hypothetical protein